MNKYKIIDYDKTFNYIEEAEQYAEKTLKLKKYTIKSETKDINYIVTKTGYRYKIISTHASSDKYGCCEICGKHASEVFHQAEEKQYEDEYTYYDCHSYFGHEKCLQSKRR